jgi:hypothetical protein
VATESFGAQDFPGWATPPEPPRFELPGLSIRATFLATDGTRPQELFVEWRNDPDREMVLLILDKISEMAGGGQVETTVQQAGKWVQQLPDGTPLGQGEPPTHHPALDESTTQLPRPYCGAQGPGHDTEGHSCTLYAGHDPVEPEGRQHRCRCGGIFATEDEVPDVPGRRSRRDDR